MLWIWAWVVVSWSALQLSHTHTARVSSPALPWLVHPMLSWQGTGSALLSHFVWGSSPASKPIEPVLLCRPVEVRDPPFGERWGWELCQLFGSHTLTAGLPTPLPPALLCCLGEAQCLTSQMLQQVRGRASSPALMTLGPTLRTAAGAER